MYLNAIAPSELTLTAIDQTNTTLAALEAELATGTTPLAVNPADTMIGTQMQGPLGMWSQTQQNLQQDQALLQTAGSATQSIQGVLQQMESLAVQASNGTNTPQNRAGLQPQYLGLPKQGVKPPALAVGISARGPIGPIFAPSMKIRHRIVVDSASRPPLAALSVVRVRVGRPRKKTCPSLRRRML